MLIRVPTSLPRPCTVAGVSDNQTLACYPLHLIHCFILAVLQVGSLSFCHGLRLHSISSRWPRINDELMQLSWQPVNVSSGMRLLRISLYRVQSNAPSKAPSWLITSVVRANVMWLNLTISFTYALSATLTQQGSRRYMEPAQSAATRKRALLHISSHLIVVRTLWWILS
ncbi:hypothetical protein DFH94DRAFT_779544 [Russula ochroleuca]|uniref:Uncharacterized protein n=1 Tax=Russula ochroleuca TaxID=152965 RepID=A0A9P5MQ42_9AGAM|nr:hypothetical protein DFH94DRAFT_779544 [Russula ochroleuca]